MSHGKSTNRHKIWWVGTMPHLAVNAAGTAARCPAGAGALRTELERLPQGGLVVMMVHGYRFAPGGPPRDDPHRHILSLDPGLEDRRALSWPRALGFGRGDAHEGLAIAFGWQARRSIWHAYAEAARAGRAMAALAGDIARQRPDLRITAIAHSLGARVVLQALAEMTAPHLDCAVLLAAAELRRPAHAALDGPAGRGATVINVTSAENAAFDFLVERLLPARADTALGFGLGCAHPGWADLALDDPATLARLAMLGYPVASPARRICHWSLYLRPGVFPLYRALLDGRLTGAELTAARTARAHATPPRRSRLLARPVFGVALPLRQKASL